MAHRSSWPPVYPGLSALPDSATHHGSPRLDVKDTSTLIAVAGSTAIITYICQHAIHAAAVYCRTNNLSFATSDQLHEFLRQRSAVVITATSAASDVAGSGKGGGEQVAKSTGERAKIGGSTPRRSRT